jgi:hypothetical protein
MKEDKNNWKKVMATGKERVKDIEIKRTSS